MKSLWKYLIPFWSSKSHPKIKNQETQESYILLTYRSGIEKVLSSTYYTSDSGWGCMLRVGQMFVANLYYKYEKKGEQEVIRLFYDNKEVAFSFPVITDTASIIFSDKKQYEWFSPWECGVIIKDMLDRFDHKFRVSLCNDNSIFLNEIQKDREVLVIMAMCRIGLDQPQPEYLGCVMQLMGNEFFNCIMGGTPRRAHLFMKYVDGYVGFLDPHETQKVTEFNDLKNRQKEYISQLRWIKPDYMDSSMGIVFVVENKRIEQFWQSLIRTKQKVGQHFFIYLERERPLFNNEGIVEMFDDEQLMIKNEDGNKRKKSEDKVEEGKVMEGNEKVQGEVKVSKDKSKQKSKQKSKGLGQKKESEKNLK